MTVASFRPLSVFKKGSRLDGCQFYTYSHAEHRFNIGVSTEFDKRLRAQKSGTSRLFCVAWDPLIFLSDPLTCSDRIQSVLPVRLVPFLFDLRPGIHYSKCVGASADQVGCLHRQHQARRVVVPYLDACVVGVLQRQYGFPPSPPPVVSPLRNRNEEIEAEAFVGVETVYT